LNLSHKQSEFDNIIKIKINSLKERGEREEGERERGREGNFFSHAYVPV